jgi:type 1 fimbria pilin
MKSRMLKIIAVALCLLLVFSTAAFAATNKNEGDDGQNSKYSVITSKSCSLTISGINSTSEAELYTSTSTSLSITMELQKLKSGSYSTIETWTSSKTGTSLSMEESRLINILATYRLKVTFTAGSETVTAYAYP